MTKSRKSRRGGSFWDSLTSGWNSASQEASSTWNSVSKGATDSLDSVSKTATNYWNSPKKSSYTPSNTNYSYTPTSPTSSSYESNNSTSYGSTFGGRKRTKNRRGGCYGSNHSSIAAHASPYSGTNTAQSRWVGGKKRKTRRLYKRKHSKRMH